MALSPRAAPARERLRTLEEPGVLVDRLSAVSSLSGPSTVLELSRADTGLEALLRASSAQLQAAAAAASMGQLAGGTEGPEGSGGEGQALLGRDAGSGGGGCGSR